MAKKAAKKVSGNVGSKVVAANSHVSAAKPAKAVKSVTGTGKSPVPAPSKTAAKSVSRNAPKLAPKSVAKPVTKPAGRTATKVAAEPLTHRLDALLHTMRTISQHEDELCTLLHDARRTGRVSVPVLRELQAVLAALPAQEYTDDLEAVLQITTTA